MAWQSSRIIWGKNKTDSSEPQPVTIYDPTGTIYVAGNYALHSDHSGSVAEDYQLYLCKVEETGSDFISSDWELQKGVKNWYLIARRQFKKGARVIKSDTNGDTASLRLYKCISSMKQPNVWNPDEWEVVYQDVGVAYEVRDHKDVYYDSGSNRNKWHKMMYYLLPENPDKSDEEIEIFSEDRVYHKDDYVIKVKNNNEVALFKYISNTPRAGWDSTRWSEDLSVTEYEANIPYNKGDWIIRKYIEIYEFVIMEFQAGLRYYNGKYCLHIINPDDINPDIPVFNENVTYSRGDRVSYNRGLWEYNLNIPLSGPWIPAYWDSIGKTFPDWYRERILGGESLYGLYRANTTVCGSWNDSEWDLIIDGVIQIRGRDYNTRGLCIMQFQIGQDYLAGDVVIWTATNDTSEFGLSVAKVDIYNCSPAQAPPNETNWDNISETLENPDQYHVYKAKDNMTAGYNSHFRRDDWLIVTQKILPDDGLYGVIWEKYGKPGGGGGIPFGFPLVIQGRSYYDPEGVNYANLDILYPFMGNSCLEIEKTFEAHDWGTPCTGGISYLTNIVYALYSNESLVRKLMVYSLTGFRELTFTDFTSIQTMSSNNDGIIYYDRLGYRIVNGGTDNRIPYGKFYKSYFGIDNIFGKILLVDIPQEIGGNYCWFRPYYVGESGWNDPDDDYLYIEQRDDVPLLVSITPIGKLMNIPSANTDLEDTSRFGQCWQDIDLYERHLCYITDDGDIVELEYFKDIHAGISTWSNGIETVTTDEYFANIAMSYIYGGKMLHRTGFDPFPGMYTTFGLHNVGGLNPYSPWFDEDWNLFPDIELVVDEDYYFNIGQVFLLYKDAPETQQLLTHLQAFCNRYGLDYHTDDMGGSNDMWAAARANKYYKFTDEGWYTSFSDPIVQKRGYAYKDRYGNVYILVHKTMQISYYSYDYESNVVSRLHIWSVISNNENKQFYTYFSKYGGQYGSQNNDGELIIIGRHDDYVLAGIRSGNTMTRRLINLKTGTMSEGSFPRYVELPYIGNANSFRIGNTTYTKARIYLGVDWSYYSSGDILPEDEGTYKAIVPFNTYWTPYIANTGGVCHTGDLLTVISVNSSAYTPSRMVVYIPQVMTNTTGIGGFIFLSGQNTNPSYGGPGENGFINK